MTLDENASYYLKCMTTQCSVRLSESLHFLLCILTWWLGGCVSLILGAMLALVKLLQPYWIYLEWGARKKPMYSYRTCKMTNLEASASQLVDQRPVECAGICACMHVKRSLLLFKKSRGWPEDLFTPCNMLPDWKMIFMSKNHTYLLAAWSEMNPIIMGNMVKFSTL